MVLYESELEEQTTHKNSSTKILGRVLYKCRCRPLLVRDPGPPLGGPGSRQGLAARKRVSAKVNPQGFLLFGCAVLGVLAN